MTRYELLTDIRYGMRLDERQDRLYVHFRQASKAGTVLGLILASASALNASPVLASIAGAILTAIAIADLIVDPAERVHDYRASKLRFADLLARAPNMSDDGLQLELIKLQAAAPTEWESLRDVALNDVMRELGHANYIEPLTIRQRLLATLA